ncbi:MAG: hypothetical protein V4689_02995 [Verrucomicrobiota bacterium]
MSYSWLKRLYLRLPVVREISQIKQALRSIQVDMSSLQRTAAGEILGELRSRHSGGNDPLRLHGSEFQVCSQNGEDGVLAEIFRRIGSTDRIFVEIGVGDNGENNTSYLHAQGWTGFWIDGDNKSERILAGMRGRQEIRARTAMVTRENITPILKEMGVPGEFDLLSIDIDQNTYHIWEGLGDYRPRVVVVEYNASIPPGIDWKVIYDPNAVWDGGINFGASLTAFEMIGRKRGYSLVHCEAIGVNAFFVRSDLAIDNFAEPFDAKNHYEPPRYTLSHRSGHGPSILDRHIQPEN